MADIFNTGPALDPATAGMLSAAFSALQNSGPSLMPQSFGQIAGGALQSGLQNYQATQSNNLTNALRAAQIQKAQQDAELTRMAMGGGGLTGFNDPDKLEQLGARLAAAGHPGGATLIDRAEKLRLAQQNAQAVTGMKSAPGTLGAGVTTSSPQGKALLSNLTGDPSFDQSVLQAQNEALNSNARPAMPAQPVQAPRAGLFDPLLNSPYVGASARTLQAQLDQSNGIPAQTWLQQFDRLANLHATAANQAAARQDTAELRRELAGNADQTRRDLAAMANASRADNRENLNEQRTFQRERQLSENYNALAKTFRTVLPQFQQAAQYVADGKYDSSGDRALVFQFAKTLDPQDRVGVNDVKDIGKLGNLPERVVQSVQSLAEGKMLPDRVRQDMFNIMRQKFGAMNELQSQIEDEYTTRAKSYMLKPENVVMPLAVRGSVTKSGGGSGGWSIKEVK